MQKAMKNKHVESLIALAKELKKRKVTKESALASLVAAGIMTEDGEISDNYPNLKRYQTLSKQNFQCTIQGQTY